MGLLDVNLKSLAAERPFHTPELFKLNDCYGHATILKRYAGVKVSYQIKGVLEHSAMLYDHVWSGDMFNPLPAIFSFSDYRFSYMRQLTNKALFAIGPSIHYAKPLMSELEINTLKEKLGKTLLVFLPHSSWSIFETFDHNLIISRLKDFEKEFENILLCFGWRDILRDMEKPYVAEGYTCITAGHIFDPNFLDRLKTWILLSTRTMSFNFGTQVGFCVYLGKPHWIERIPTKKEAPPQIEKTATYKGGIYGRFQGKYIFSIFKEPVEGISEKQRELVDIMWGTSHIKSSRELKEIFDITEDMYRAKYLPCDRQTPVFFSQMCDYICEGKIERAKKLYNYARLIKYHPDWMSCFRGLIAYKENRMERAINIADKLRKRKFFRELGKLLREVAENRKGIEILRDSFFSLYPKINIYRKEERKFVWED